MSSKVKFISRARKAKLLQQLSQVQEGTPEAKAIREQLGAHAPLDPIEEAKKKAEAEAVVKAAQDAARKAQEEAEAKRKAAEEAARKKKADAAAKRKAEQVAKKKAASKKKEDSKKEN